MTPQLGDILGDYKVIGTAGAGGMGAVYKIEHLITKRVEAMKLLPEGVSSDPEQIARFEREIQVQARLHHPHIVTLYNALRDGTNIILIMEFVEGESLQRMLEAGPLPLPAAIDFVTQILSALSYAHSEGVIHRDVAPANIIITHDRIAKLTDFGLARTPSDLRLTVSGAPVGSPCYMSPEQVRGISPIDGRTDIYATGAVLHEMLTGRKLFEGDSAFAVMRAHVETEPTAPSAHNPGIPAAIDQIVCRALAKDPAERFQSADEFRDALEQAHPLGRLSPVSMPASPALPLRRARSLIPLALAPAVLVAALGILAYVYKPVPVPSPQHAPSAAAVAKIEPPPPLPEAPAEVTVSPSPETPRPAQPPAAQIVRRPVKPAPTYAIRVSGGEVESASTVLPPPPAPAPKPVAVLPEPPLTQPAVNAVPPEPETPAAGLPATPQKPGNRLVRALDKINPFHKKNP